MASTEQKFTVKRLSHNTTVHVTIHFAREFRLRLFVAKCLIVAAAWVMNCNVEITDNKLADVEAKG